MLDEKFDKIGGKHVCYVTCIPKTFLEDFFALMENILHSDSITIKSINNINVPNEVCIVLSLDIYERTKGN